MTAGNREHWNATSDAYQAAHDPQLRASPKAWGGWSVPESQLNALGDLSGKRVLEFGCGAGQWSAALADDGVDVFGLDLSERQLAAARRHMRTPYPLVHAAAEHVPFRERSFDVVFCDHGAIGWGDPALVLPEAARVLRPGGRLAFCVTSPWLNVCYDEATDVIDTSFHQSYFELGPADEGHGAKTHQLRYGDYVRLLRATGFVIEDLIEPRPAPDAHTTYYRTEPLDWPYRWPVEMLWVARRQS